MTSILTFRNVIRSKSGLYGTPPISYPEPSLMALGTRLFHLKREGPGNEVVSHVGAIVGE